MANQGSYKGDRNFMGIFQYVETLRSIYAPNLGWHEYLAALHKDFDCKFRIILCSSVCDLFHVIIHSSHNSKMNFNSCK